MKWYFYLMDKLFGNGKSKRKNNKDSELCDD